MHGKMGPDVMVAQLYTGPEPSCGVIRPSSDHKGKRRARPEDKVGLRVVPSANDMLSVACGNSAVNAVGFRL